MRLCGGSRKVAGLAGIWMGLFAQVDAKSWSAQPIEVHEWGVNSFDWSVQGQTKPTFPPHIYTPEKPGKPLSHPIVKQGKKNLPIRVKDMTPDSGIRYKPVLYFYPPSYLQEVAVGNKIERIKRYRSAPVAVEMRFRYGDACAWYPQVSKYRSPEVTSNASAIDWDAWRQENGIRGIAGGSGKGFHRTNILDSQRGLVIPDDGRFELVWDRLTLNPAYEKWRAGGFKTGGDVDPDSPGYVG